MTIKAIKEKYKNWKVRANERNSFMTYDYRDGNGKIVIIVNISKSMKDYVTGAVRVRDGKELIKDGRCRPFDNLDDAIDVACEMMEV